MRWIEDRREHLTANADCREHHYEITVYAERDGTIRGVDCEAIVDSGAYSAYPFSACLEAAQVATRYAIEVDGTPLEIALRADYVVARDGERYIAEVKTGEVAPRLQSPGTRRQLLEYSIAFRASGVLLVDAETRSVHRVAFPAAPGTQRRSPFVWALAFAAVVLAGIAALR